MPDRPDQPEAPRPRQQGEAAWKAAKARVEARNDETRKAGKKQRAAFELQRADRRRMAELRERADLEGKPR